MTKRTRAPARAAACIAACALLCVLSPTVLAASAAPAFAQVKAAYRSSEAQLLDRHGVPIQSARTDLSVRRLAWTPYADVSPALVAAVVQAEDQHFFTHDGVDLKAVAAAAWDNLFREHARGASTITMQLAAMLAPELQAQSGGRSLGQKWSQAQAARELEKTWSKTEILEAYLNLLPLRGELQGIAGAANALFDKAPSGLNAVESVLLASLIRAPNAPQKLVAARACALAKERQLTTPCDAIATTLTLALNRGQAGAAIANNGPNIGAAPALQAAYAALKTASSNAQPLPQQIRSTLDAGVQQAAVDSLRQQMALLTERNVNDGAVIVLDNASGDMLAYVGNAGGSNVDGVIALRQAGSTLKPFLYGLAIEKKLLTAASVIDDAAIDISTPSGLYVPQNYDRQFKGYVSVRTSLASSLNVPAVRTLVLTGLDGFYNRLRDLGLNSLSESPEYYGYSLALGSAEVSLRDLTNAYRTLANGGLAGETALLARPPGAKTPAPHRVIDAGAAFIVGDILSDRAARSTTFGLSNELATPYWSAVKTGTSKDMRDNWCIGYSEKYTVGVWVGNFDGQAMWDVSGVSGAAPVWRDVMDYLHKGRQTRAPQAPAGVVARTVQFAPEVEAARKEWFIAGTEIARIDIIFDVARTAKIRYPANNSIIATDPDIPAALQRVFFQARAGTGLSWQLDGKPYAEAARDVAWLPQPGKHRLMLLAGDGKVIDTVDFQVRGNAVEAPAR